VFGIFELCDDHLRVGGGLFLMNHDCPGCWLRGEKAIRLQLSACVSNVFAGLVM
jgi:hypothetical protein